MSFGGPATDFGATAKSTPGVNPSAQAAGAVNGPAIDRQDFESCQVAFGVGATTGTPTSFTADFKLQHSSDGSTGWTDYAPGGAGAATAAVGQLTAANTSGRANRVLSGAKRYIRVVSTVAFVGGTTPTVVTQATVALGGARLAPAV